MRYLPYLLFALASLLVGYSNWRQRGLKPTALAAQFTFSPAAFEMVLAKWRPEQIETYRKMLGLDFLTIAFYAAGGLLLAWGCSTQAPLIAAMLTGLVLMAAGADLTENLLHWRFTTPGQPAALSSLYGLSGVATCVKFASGIAFALLTIFAQRA